MRDNHNTNPGAAVNLAMIHGGEEGVMAACGWEERKSGSVGGGRRLIPWRLG